MALYAMGDMHLAFSVDKPMDRFGKVWKKHEDIPLRDHSTSIQKGRLSDGMKPMRNRPKSW